MTPFLRSAIHEMLPHAGSSSSCAECGFPWLTTGDAALAVVQDGPDRFARLLEGQRRTVQRTSQAWQPSAFVWHVGDVVRAWSERLHSLGAAPDAPWAGFDPDDLARARHYDALPATSASWALARSVDALVSGMGDLAIDAPFVHPEWGSGTVTDALRWLAHETEHHDLDIRRATGQHPPTEETT